MGFYRNTSEYAIKTNLFGVGYVDIPAGDVVELPDHLATVLNNMSSPNTPLEVLSTDEHPHQPKTPPLYTAPNTSKRTPAKSRPAPEPVIDVTEDEPLEV